MKEFNQIDYLVIGHICLDLTTEGPVPGGTALYSALAAQALGCRTAVLTSTDPDFDLTDLLPGIVVERIPSKQTTIFENIYIDSDRQQKIHEQASRLQSEHVPEAWQRSTVVHLGPIANEIDPRMVNLFSNSLVGLTPQGWYRRWGDDGRVFAADWLAAAEALPFVAAVVLSLSDLPGPETLIQIRNLTPIVVVTEQAQGCTVYFRGEARHIPAPAVPEVNPTGAGDIFAAAFFVRLYQTRGNPWEAADFANRIAAASVAQKYLTDKLTAIQELIGQEG